MHIAYLTTLLEELDSRGITASDLIDPVPADISPEQLALLLDRALRITGDPALGLCFGMRLNLASHGMLGYTLMSSRNGDQLFSTLTRFVSLAVPHIELQRMVAGDSLRLVCRPDAMVQPHEFYMELMLSTLVSGARALFNQHIPGAAIWFDYPKPAHAERYAKLRVPVQFNQPYSALVCHRDFLEMELPSANSVLAEIGARQCYELLSQMQRRGGLAKEVRAALLRANGEFPDQQKMSTRLNISTRTLRRRLDQEGTSYREMLDEVRFALAREYLMTAEFPVTEVARLLGYEDPANFRRAFKRWSGTTAQAWREQT